MNGKPINALLTDWLIKKNLIERQEGVFDSLFIGIKKLVEGYFRQEKRAAEITTEPSRQAEPCFLCTKRNYLQSMKNQDIWRNQNY